MHPSTAITVFSIFIPFGVFGLQCYICKNEQSNDKCSREEDLVTCEKARDTCQTVVSYSHVSEKMFIDKKCTKNTSCELQINATRDDTPCDVTQATWICTSCCHDDKCNTDGAFSQHAIGWAVPFLAAFLATKIEKIIS